MSNLDYYLTADPKAMTDAELLEAESGLAICRRILNGFPTGTKLWDAALCMNARRDPSAIEFMQTFEAAA